MGLVIAAEILVVIAIFKNYGWRAWVGEPASSRHKKGGLAKPPPE